MKFLTFVDLHEDAKVLKEIVGRASENDIEFMVCAGDLSWFGKNLLFMLKHLNKVGKKVLLLPGNHETDEMFKEALRDYPHCLNFNKKAVKIEDYVFLGYGEGGFSLEDQEFRKVSREWYGKYNGEKIVLVTHAPPFGTKVDLVERRHVGNHDYRRFIERIKPKLVICGHLHETAGTQDKIDRTKVVNPGWEGMVIELN